VSVKLSGCVPYYRRTLKGELTGQERVRVYLRTPRGSLSFDMEPYAAKYFEPGRSYTMELGAVNVNARGGDPATIDFKVTSGWMPKTTFTAPNA
jgi:hypothetical protein